MHAAFVWAIIFVVFVIDLLFAVNQLLQFLQVILMSHLLIFTQGRYSKHICVDSFNLAY